MKMLKRLLYWISEKECEIHGRIREIPFFSKTDDTRLDELALGKTNTRRKLFRHNHPVALLEFC